MVNRISPAKEAEILHLLANKVGINEIARVTGVSKNTVTRHERLAGLDLLRETKPNRGQPLRRRKLRASPLPVPQGGYCACGCGNLTLLGRICELSLEGKDRKQIGLILDINQSYLKAYLAAPSAYCLGHFHKSRHQNQRHLARPVSVTISGILRHLKALRRAAQLRKSKEQREHGQATLDFLRQETAYNWWTDRAPPQMVLTSFTSTSSNLPSSIAQWSDYLEHKIALEQPSVEDLTDRHAALRLMESTDPFVQDLVNRAIDFPDTLTEADRQKLANALRAIS